MIRIIVCSCCLLFHLMHHTFAQDQKVVDSLQLILNREVDLPDSIVVRALVDLMIFSTSPDDILKYAEQLTEKSKGYEPVYYSIQANTLSGVAYRQKGDIKKSLESLFAGVNKAIEHNRYRLQHEAYLEIASTYAANSDHKNALHFEKKGLEVIRKHGNDEQLAPGLLNIGFSYYTLNKFDSALLCYNEAEPIFDRINMKIGKAYTLGNRALVLWKQGNIHQAETDLLRSVEMLQVLGDQFGMADYHNQLGNLYFEQGFMQKAIQHTGKAFEMAKALGLKEQVRDAVLLLSKLYTNQGDFEKALFYQSEHILYKDSIQNTALTKKMADLRTEFEVNLREKQIDLLEKREALSNIYILVVIILLALSIVTLLFFRQRFLNTKLVASNERKLHSDNIKDLMKSHETKALQSIVQGRDNERKRLAKELHNHFGSLLATIKVNINGIEEEAIPNHRNLTTLVDQACEDMRTISHSLNMGISENFGLVPALKELTDHLRHSGNIEVEFDASMGDGLIDSKDEIIVYRIVQELLSNVMKHAEATKLSVLLTCYEEEGLVNILVHDNGKGLDMKEVAKKSDGIGLNSLKEMVDDKGGDFNLDSHANSGTTVAIDLPIIIESKII